LDRSPDLSRIPNASTCRVPNSQPILLSTDLIATRSSLRQNTVLIGISSLVFSNTSLLLSRTDLILLCRVKSRKTAHHPLTTRSTSQKYRMHQRVGSLILNPILISTDLAATHSSLSDTKLIGKSGLLCSHTSLHTSLWLSTDLILVGRFHSRDISPPHILPGRIPTASVCRCVGSLIPAPFCSLRLLPCTADSILLGNLHSRIVSPPLLSQTEY
jgi:hypothetical protein